MKTQNIFPYGSKKQESLCMKLKQTLFLFFILPLVACPLWGQVVQKKQLTESDYMKWGELIVGNPSPDGRWITYRMRYESGSDTLFVRNTINGETFNMPGGIFPRFAGNEHLIVNDKNSIQSLSLKTGMHQSYPLDTHIEYSTETDQIITLLRKEKQLQLQKLSTGVISLVNDVADFSMSPTQKEIIISIKEKEKYSVGILNLRNSAIEWIARQGNGVFYNFAWEENGKAVAFYSSSDSIGSSTDLCLYKLETKKILRLNQKELNNFASDKIFDKTDSYPLTISSDLDKVFFGLNSTNIEVEQKAGDGVEVWNTADKWIYPLEQSSGRFYEKANLAVWHPSNGCVVKISSSEFPSVMLNGNKTLAIISNPKQYEPQFEIVAPRDYYLVDLDTGQKEIMVKKQSGYHTDLLPSPSGRFVAYYKDKNWWIYDVKMKIHINITQHIKVPFFGRVNGLGGDAAYGNPGWTPDEKEILLYDQYDIWGIKNNGTLSRRLTKGREDKTIYRINTLGDYDLLLRNFDGFKSIVVDLNDRLILRTQYDDGKTGYCSLEKTGAIEQIICRSSFLNHMHYIKKSELYIYQEQRFDLPPRLVAKNNSSMEKITFQSNAHYEKFQHSTSELITYRNAAGKELKGILYFPSNFDTNKKYPMIVYIYEKQSHNVHKYINPTLLSGNGFNESVITTKDYLILCPDIEHETGTVGENTVDCVVSATNHVIGKNFVDPLKIGLMGESFGGYETNFIITQTDIFAAAVSGASIADLTSFYLTVGWDLSISDMTRFQSEQWRLGKSPFEDPDLYSRNSPITNATSIKTPILIWAGKSDWHVNWNQSVEFYMALRRLGKPATMLLYPDEKHILMKEKNQKDLSLRINQWFDYYLKNDQSVGWPKEAVN
ncbi:S9 family peptidase [Flavobacterium lipolyticum]|uniref:Prolyl oligopeptidase family serine peptidase n=1 Tax=Flavobacterium lipolyticum TaxID=2893754 RepID=A0ABS8M6F8_9FLAO|nr:prolyl oligopeptidase family serine peptidase [Flavobacterium sp. F-126]MCC9020413.1 prolyl oligopeptidase family serine peptidase [Flavobacterium sp. F-126]